MIIARPATPPTTPPAMAPLLIVLAGTGEGVGVGEVGFEVELVVGFAMNRFFRAGSAHVEG